MAVLSLGSASFLFQSYILFSIPHWCRSSNNKVYFWNATTIIMIFLLMGEFWKAVNTLEGGPELGQGYFEVNFKCAKATERSTVPGTPLGQALGPCWRPTVLREWLTVYCWSQIRPKTPFSSWISHSPSSLTCQPRATLSCQLICYASLPSPK